MNKIIFFVMVLLFLVFLFNLVVSAQPWKEIVPLVSTCEDVKKILKVNECEFPSAEYVYPKYEIIVYFAEKSSEYNVSTKTVVRVLILLKHYIRLEDYETNLQDYVIVSEGDLPDSWIYKNDKTGVKLTVQNTAKNTKDIVAITLYPSLENKEKFKCKP